MSRLIPSLASSPTAVDREIGSEYDNVKIVADNIDDIVLIAQYGDNLGELSDSIITLTPILVDAAENLEAIEDTVLQARDETLVAKATTVEASAATLLYSQNAKESELNSAESEANSLESSEESAASAAIALESKGVILQSEINTRASENLAQEWAANPVDSSVTGHDGKYSAYHYSVKAEESAESIEGINQSVISLEASTGASAEAAAISEANALVSESNASSSSSAALIARDIVLASESNVVALEQTVEGNTATVVQLAGEVETNASNLSNAVESAITQAGLADSSRQAAELAESEAEASLDEFNKLYLGKFESDPVTGVGGIPLEVGAFYFNTGNQKLRVYTSSGWNPAILDASGAVVSFNGRSGNVVLTNDDVTTATGKDISTMKSAAFTDSSDYATASQGALADTALQSYTETDPVFSAWDKSEGITITENQIMDFGDYETRDPSILRDADIGSTVQSYNLDTVIDGSYVHTDNNFSDNDKTTLDKTSAVTGTTSFNRYDKLLANRDIVNMVYSADGLETVIYQGDNSTDVFYRDELSYSVGKLSEVQHFYGAVDTQTPSGITSLVYTGDNLTSTNYTE